jgi:hypothetical protein
MKRIIALTSIILAFSLAGCNEDPKEKQASDAAKANEDISKSTAAPSSTPSEKKYKY